jgi:hypothetical protein
VSLICEMAKVMLFTCSSEENALLSAMRSVSLTSTEKLNRFLTNLASQTGASSAIEVVQQVLDGTSSYSGEVPFSDYRVRGGKNNAFCELA